MIRLVEGAVAVGVGAADAFIEDKGAGPGGVPWVVYFDGLAIGAGLFGERFGLAREIADPLAFAALAVAGARLTDAAQAGKLAQGPRSWGASVGAYSHQMAAANAPAGLPAAAASSIRLLPGRSFTQSAFSMSPTLVEASGTMG